jgi:uncharacterized protein (TIGR03067 family)
MQGTWEVANFEGDNPPPDIKQLVFKDDRMLAGDLEMGRFTLDPKKSPKHFDFTAGDGPPFAPQVRGKLVPGIYELKGDELKICSTVPDKERPTEFAANAERQCVLLVLKRKK